MINRRHAVEMFGVAARHPDIAELHLVGHKIWLVSNPAWVREVMADNGRSVGKARASGC